jgi:hypothetical protein
MRGACRATPLSAAACHCGAPPLGDQVSHDGKTRQYADPGRRIVAEVEKRDGAKRKCERGYGAAGPATH